MASQVLPPEIQILAAEVEHPFVKAKCDFFLTVQLWPTRAEMDPERWLDNFQESELDHAIHLLNIFLYFSTALVNQVFRSVFQRLSLLQRQSTDSYLKSQASWQSFFDTLLVTHVTGENPNPTDSGYLFARKARQELDIPQERILPPEEALRFLWGAEPRPLIFVDDFVGTGQQFTHTWNREYEIEPGLRGTFAQLAERTKLPCFYIPIVCTEDGRRRLRQECPEVTVAPGHLLSDRYNALAPNSVLWPGRLLPTARDFIRTASLRAGIPDTDGADVHDWQGFNKLGLAIALEAAVPDATLPIFYWEENGWNPLVRRR